MAIAAGEAQAELLSVHESLLMRIPDGLSFTEAAAIPEAYITAHDAIFTQGDLKSDQTLLIHAVASGVGIAAMQMARQAGATVIGTSRTADKLSRCRELGLEHDIATGDSTFADQVKSLTKGCGAWRRRADSSSSD